MNTTYVPHYLINVERQFDGWPKCVTDEQKEEATAAAKEILKQFPQGVDLDLVYRQMQHRRVSAIKDAVLYDYIYAVCHRALLAAQAVQIWVLPASVRKSDDYKEMLEAEAMKSTDIKCIKDGEDNIQHWEIEVDYVNRFPEMFPGCIYNREARQILREVKVLRHNSQVIQVMHDSEGFGSFTVKFSSWETANNYRNRFNEWVWKKKGEINGISLERMKEIRAYYS